MSPEANSPEPSEEDIRRQQMLDAITDAVSEEDYEFATEIVNSQALLRPYELVEYMNVKRRHAEDPVESRRWEDALRSLLNSLSGKEFPQEELDVINNIIDGLEFESITSNEDVAEEKTTEFDGEKSDDENWDNSQFIVKMDEEEIERIRKLPLFKQAEAYATEQRTTGNPLDAAKRTITNQTSGEIKQKMLQVLDWYIYKRAEEYATEQRTTGNPLDAAKRTVEQFASSPETEAEINLALDKHVFNRAEQYATGQRTSGNPLNAARETIVKYASTPGRRDAMLRRLGFM